MSKTPKPTVDEVKNFATSLIEYRGGGFDCEVSDGVVMLTTRANGSVADEEAGEADIKTSHVIRRAVSGKFPTTHGIVVTCDEWTTLEIRIYDEVIPPLLDKGVFEASARKVHQLGVVLAQSKGMHVRGFDDIMTDGPAARDMASGHFRFSVNLTKEWNSRGAQVELIAARTHRIPNEYIFIVRLGSLSTTANSLSAQSISFAWRRLLKAAGTSLEYSSVLFRWNEPQNSDRPRREDWSRDPASFAPRARFEKLSRVRIECGLLDGSTRPLTKALLSDLLSRGWGWWGTCQDQRMELGREYPYLLKLLD